MIPYPVKALLKYAMELDIIHLETFTGYKGDTVIKLILEKSDDIPKLVKFAKNMGLDSRQDYQLDGRYSGAYTLFIAMEHKDIYQLKP